MTQYFLKRLLQAIPTLLLVSFAVFGLIRLIPGDPAQLLLGDAADASSLALLHAKMGLDKSLLTQYFNWMGDILQGNFGVSLTNGVAIFPEILERFQVSGVIVICAVALAVLISVPAGLLAAWKHNSTLDILVITGATLLLSIPSFWLGILLMLFFGLHLGWLPIVGYVSLSESLSLGMLYLILPILTLAWVETGVFTRMARASAIEVLRLEYVAHARAKGCKESRVLLRHVLPNAFAPTLTLVGLVLGNLLGGIAVLETVFTLPGLGRFLVDAIFARDYPVIQGCLLFIAFIYILVNLLVDLCYPLLDPRVAIQ